VDEKVYSIFETHTDLIKRGKARKLVEFGHKVFLAESAQGLITDYQVLEGNPADSVHVAPSLERHQKTFRQAPELYAGDRGFDSVENREKCREAGVGHIGIPQTGRNQDRGAKSLRAQPAVQEEPTVPGGH
jgi:transposase, IS5 family